MMSLIGAIFFRYFYASIDSLTMATTVAGTRQSNAGGKNIRRPHV